jgi:hypothetical protein
MVQAVECLPSMHKALCSNSTTKERKRETDKWGGLVW